MNRKNSEEMVSKKKDTRVQKSFRLSKTHPVQGRILEILENKEVVELIDGRFIEPDELLKELVCLGFSTHVKKNSETVEQKQITQKKKQDPFAVFDSGTEPI